MVKKQKTIIELTNELRINCNKYRQIIIDRHKHIKFVYNPLDYAWKPHEYYLNTYGNLGAKKIIMGMNPGHGMGNTGIPFGCPLKVKSYLNITDLKVKKPKIMHPKRKIFGLECKKPEISGKRMWSLIEEIYGPPNIAFKDIFIINHFPLWMFNESGQNITPNKLNYRELKNIFKICNNYLIDLINILNIKEIICVGKYAHNVAKKVINEAKMIEIKIKEIPHPSPANPIANKEKGEYWKRKAKNIIKF